MGTLPYHVETPCHMDQFRLVQLGPPTDHIGKWAVGFRLKGLLVILHGHCSIPIWSAFINYRPQTMFAKVMFLHVSVCPQWGDLQAHTRGGGWGVWQGGSPGPHPGWKLRGLAGGLQAHTWGVSPGPHPGGSRPTPWGGSPGPHPGGLQAHNWGSPGPHSGDL